MQQCDTRESSPPEVAASAAAQHTAGTLEADLRRELRRRATPSEAVPPVEQEEPPSPERTWLPSPAMSLADESSIRLVGAPSEFRLATAEIGITYVNMRPFARPLLRGGSSGLMPS